jgi:Spy/CpxP family protein refolding chaperone
MAPVAAAARRNPSVAGPREEHTVIIDSRRVRLALVLGLLGLFQGSAVAAKPRQEARPARRQIRLKTIWAYQKELGLTGDQVQQMKDAFTRLQEYLKACRERIVPAEQKVREMIEAGEPIDKIKPWLQSVATIQVEMRVADIKASREINAAMKPDQLKKWQEIQKKARETGATPSEPPQAPEAAGQGRGEASPDKGQ